VSEGNVRDVPAATWSDRNQRWLSARIAFWRGRLAPPDAPFSGPVPSDDDLEFTPAALQLRGLFGLSAFETELLILAAGVEIDTGLRRAIAAAHGSPSSEPVRLTFSLALSLLPEPHWDASSPDRPLRHWSLLELETSTGLAQATARVDERILHYLTGVPATDGRLTGLVRLEDGLVGAEDNELTASIAHALDGSPAPLVMLRGTAEDISRRREALLQVRAAFEHVGLRTLSVDPSLLPGEPRELIETARRLDREAALIGAGIALVFGPDAGNAARLIAALRSPIITIGALSPTQLADCPDRRVCRFNVPVGNESPTRGLPPVVARAAAAALQQFHVDAAALEQAVASINRPDCDEDIDEHVWDALREAARGGLDALAQRIDSRAAFEDLVVPASVSAQLHEIAGQLRHRAQVYDEWGFGDRDRRGLGVAALFAGESGTGKTLAAEAIANAVRLDLYRIDLAAVVSKYIGETEKNLSRVFDAAERSGAVLLFDEADALFGKRSDVKDSHDRYANIEVAYLLQRIESYRGLAVLTTNMKSALDRSFLRRIRFVVQFPFPDEAARGQIWRRQFPSRAPLAGVDFAALAKLQLSGGHIRSVALNAAFRAAARGTSIEHEDVVAAARAEYAKLERTFNAPRGTAA
jgi:hypothetical protein